MSAATASASTSTLYNLPGLSLPKVPKKIERLTDRACRAFDEARASGKLTLEALSYGQNIFRRVELSREYIDYCWDFLAYYADQFFDEDYPEGTFSYSSPETN